MNEMFKNKNQVPSVSGIYALHCPKSLEIRYIGQAKNIRNRIFSHFRGDGLNCPKTEWIKGLKKESLLPLVSILEKSEDLNAAEVKHIKRIGLKRLLNIHHGGEWEGRSDPLPWRVVGVSYPSKMLYLRCRNVGVNNDTLKKMRLKASSFKNTFDRLEFEIKVANQLLDTDIENKIRKWFSVVLPRIEVSYPEMLRQ